MTAVKEQPFPGKISPVENTGLIFSCKYILQIRQNSGLRDFEIVLKYIMYGQNIQ